MMAATRKILKFFLASPSDLQQEREDAKRVVENINAVFGDHFGCRIELVVWEDTVPGFGRPQDQINRRRETCEVFIGMLWRRWGSPPDKSGEFTSGFEEEFETSLKSRRENESPEIWQFFKRTESSSESIDELTPNEIEGIKKVQEFKQRIWENKEILTQDFSSRDGFQDKLRFCIGNYLIEHHQQENNRDDEERQTRSPDEAESQSADESGGVSEPFLTLKGIEFVKALIDRAEKNSEDEKPTDAEIARFRLLACVYGQQTNDEIFLGVHDANILFFRRSQFDFSSREIVGLLDSGLRRISSENVPIWHWLSEFEAFSNEWLACTSVLAPKGVRVGALTAMQMISEPLHSDGRWDWQKCSESWFSETESNEVKEAALGYLAECGTSQNLTVIRKEIDKDSYGTKHAAIEAALAITMRDSHEKAINLLMELQPEKVSSDLLERLFENWEALTTSVLSQGTGHRNPGVRRTVVSILRERQELEQDVAEQLLSDSDAGVRYEALKVLEDHGREFSDEDARRILVKPKTRTGLGFFGSSFPRSQDPEGEELLSIYRKERLQALKTNDLELEAKQSEHPRNRARFVLFEREFRKYGDYLRECVDDEFKHDFRERLDLYRQKHGPDNVVVNSMIKTETHDRKEMTRWGLDIISKNGDAKVLNLRRKTIGGGFVDYSNLDVDYLKRWGEWEDIPLLISSVENSRRGLLSSPNESNEIAVSEAIYRLGQNRFEELLSLEMPGGILTRLISMIPDTHFKNLRTTSIQTLFQSDVETVRKTTALKCVKNLPKSQLVQILGEYGNREGFRYYNVFFWLDFGVSLPRTRARRAAKRILDGPIQSSGFKLL